LILQPEISVDMVVHLDIIAARSRGSASSL